MDDADLRGELLKTFYGLRFNAGGWVPTEGLNLNGATGPMGPHVIGSVCEQLAGAGLIDWKPLHGLGYPAGMAKITGLGVDVTTGSRSSSIDVRLSNAGQLDPSLAMGSLAQEAEAANKPAYRTEAAKAVYEAIESLVAAGKRAYAHSVPLEAEKILIRDSGGKLRSADASAQIREACIGLAENGRIEAYAEPRKDWIILEPLVPENSRMATSSRKIFIVHGHDGEAREKLARYLEKLDFEPIILHEQANRGRTIIEKVEANSDVDFAVVLLTPDDEGCKKGEALEPRVRQNVLLELGYFIGKLSRERVCAFRRGTVNIPSDFAGVVWTEMDEFNGWKQELVRELKAAGYSIDGNKAMA